MNSTSPILSPLFNPVYVCPEDFAIIVDNETYYCHKIVVFTLSNVICNEAMKNPKLSSFTIPKESISDPNRYFKLINEYFHGKEIKLTYQNVPFIWSISQYLQLQQLSELAKMSVPPLTKENALDIMKQFSQNKIPFEDCEKLIAENWEYYMTKPEIFDLPVYAFQRIIDSEYFSYSNESELFNFIKKLSSKSHEYTSLFGLCYPEKLQQDNIQDIITLSEYDSIEPDVIRLLIDIIDPSEDDSGQYAEYPNQQNIPNIQNVQNVQNMQQFSSQQQPSMPYQQNIQGPGNLSTPQLSSEYRNSTIMKPFFESQDTEISPGIFSFFQDQFGKNLNSILKLETPKNSHALFSILQYGPNTFTEYWDNKDRNKYTQSTAYIIVKFVGYQIELQHFTMCCNVSQLNSYQPKSLSVQGSNDGSSWSSIQTIQKCDANKRNPKLNVPISNPKGKFSSFKFTLSSTYSNKEADRYHFNISALELYGNIYPLN